MRDLTALEIVATAEAMGLEIDVDEAQEVAHCVNALRDALLPWDTIDLNSIGMRTPFFHGTDHDDF